MASKSNKRVFSIPDLAKPGAPLLDQILAPANLAAAWEAVAANAGMPGADRVGVSRYGRNWEERVTALADAVRGNRYRPGRLRVRFIPKRRDHVRIYFLCAACLGKTWVSTGPEVLTEQTSIVV